MASRSSRRRAVAPQLADELERNHVKFSGEIPNTFLSRPAVVGYSDAVLLRHLVLRVSPLRAGPGRMGGLMSIGRSKAKVYVETDTKTTFNDVAGVDEAKAELKEIVDFLKHPAEYGRLGARMPKGVLLVGPPGHRQDPARAGGRRRGGRAVLLDQRLGIRRDVRRRRRGAGARPLRAGAREGPGDHLHRRARRAGPRPRRLSLHGARREGADAQPVAGRDGRFRFAQRPGADRGDQPAGDPRSGAAARRPVRPPGAGRPAGQARAHRNHQSLPQGPSSSPPTSRRRRSPL